MPHAPSCVVGNVSSCECVVVRHGQVVRCLLTSLAQRPLHYKLRKWARNMHKMQGRHLGLLLGLMCSSPSPCTVAELLLESVCQAICCILQNISCKNIRNKRTPSCLIAGCSEGAQTYSSWGRCPTWRTYQNDSEQGDFASLAGT